MDAEFLLSGSAGTWPLIRTGAHAEFKEAAAQVLVHRKHVWPDRVFSRNWMASCRKEAAEEIAFRLTRDGVGVR